MHTLTVVFLIILAAMLATQLWLAIRHVRHVATHRHEVPAAFRDKIALDAHANAADYTIARTRFGMLENIFGAAILIIWTMGGGLDQLDHAWRSVGLGPIATGIGFIITMLFISTLLDIPFTLYQTFGIEQRFGFNKMTFRLFLSDLAMKGLLMLIIGLPLLLAILWLMERMGGLWWLYVWLLWTGFSLSMLWAYPAFIAPLFNKFRPLEQESLLARIRALLERTGFRSQGVFVMDGSRRSAHGNAYFTGLGRNKRIVFFDTLLKTLDEGEVEAVLAHELGHFRLKHVVRRMAVVFTTSFIGLAILGYLIAQPWFYSALGVAEPSTYAALTLFMMIGPVLTFFLHPLFAWGSRRHEYEADAFAARQTQASALVTALVKLYEENAATLTPDPLHSAFYDSHPPATARIAHLEALT